MTELGDHLKKIILITTPHNFSDIKIEKFYNKNNNNSIISIQ